MEYCLSDITGKMETSGLVSIFDKMSLPIHRICRSYIFVITKKCIVEIMEGEIGERFLKQRIHCEKIHLNY